jgi:hypothetical protein
MRARRSNETDRRAADRVHYDWWQWLAALAPPTANVEEDAVEPRDRARARRPG